MTNKNDSFMPDIAIPPGETLKELLEDKSMSQKELADRTGLSSKHINEIINGKAPITQETSLKLENVLGIPASFWNNLESDYQETLARLKQLKEIEEEQAIAREVPYPEVANLGWVDKTRKVQEKVVNLRKFFQVASLNYVSKMHVTAFRKAEDKDASSYALATWLQKGELEAHKIETKPFDENKLKSYLTDFRKLTLQPPEVFEVKLKEMCAECGIGLVLLPHIKGTYANGATKWLNKDKVMILLSLRFKYADIFWFSFFHELGHVLLHGKKNVFIEDRNFKDEKETEADDFASKVLIPKKEYVDFVDHNNFSRTSIIRFAKSIDVHPCIVIGRLQKEKLLSYKFFSDLKPRLQWSE